MIESSAQMTKIEHVEPHDVHLDAVLERLVSVGSLTVQDLERGRRAGLGEGDRLDLILNKLGLVSDDALTEAWASLLKLTIVEVTDYPEKPVLAEALSYDFLSHAQVMPIRIEGNLLTLAVVDPLDRFSPKAVAAKTGLSIKCHLARSGEFMNALARLYDDGIEKDLEKTFGNGAPLADDIERLKDLASDAPVIRIVNGLIDRAIESRASDLHIVATRTGSRVRYRVDGILIDGDIPPSGLHAAIVSRLKIMAGLDIAERRLPQDGRIRIPWRGREIDLRVATMPHIDGEGLVLRVLDRSAVNLDFGALGLSQPVRDAIAHVLSAPHGLFLVSGPTGSGKTTTLYAALKAVMRPELNVITVEDPVEHRLDGVGQIQIHRRIGFDFAAALRAVLRQDPDVIMVGEIRDRETAAVANQAALTGHLVLATIHTNTALAALPRLVDMDVEPYLLASTLRGAMAQRLVRRLCPHCRTDEAALVETSGISSIGRDQRLKIRSFCAVGCAACKGTGYSGRIAIAEVLVMSEPVRDGLLRGYSESELMEAALTSGFVPMIDDGIAKVEEGITTLDEVLRVVRAV
jgi:general secretion pathway protein E